MSAPTLFIVGEADISQALWVQGEPPVALLPAGMTRVEQAEALAKLLLLTR